MRLTLFKLSVQYYTVSQRFIRTPSLLAGMPTRITYQYPRLALVLAL